MCPFEPDTLHTRPTLLSKVRRGDEQGWRQFYQLYRGFIYSAARGAGLTHEQAQDVLQETMTTVQNYISNFAPDARKARFRTWLRKLVHSRIVDFYRQQKRNPLQHAIAAQTLEGETATSVICRIPNYTEVELDRLIDGQLEDAILAQARESAKAKTSAAHYQAYDLFAVQGLTAKQVALSLGIAPATVRIQAHRIRCIVNREARKIVQLLGKK